MSNFRLFLCACLCAISLNPAFAQSKATTYRIKCDPSAAVSSAMRTKLEAFHYHNGENVIEKSSSGKTIVVFQDGKPRMVKVVSSDGSMDEFPVEQGTAQRPVGPGSTPTVSDCGSKLNDCKKGCEAIADARSKARCLAGCRGAHTACIFTTVVIH